MSCSIQGHCGVHFLPPSPLCLCALSRDRSSSGRFFRAQTMGHRARKQLLRLQRPMGSSTLPYWPSLQASCMVAWLAHRAFNVI